MPNDKVEFDVIINGKPAKKSLSDIKKELNTLEKQDDRTTKSMKTNWIAVGAGIAVAGAAMLKATSSALALEKATFGLTKATKEYIRQASIQYGMSQDIIAGFVQTGKTAGMSGAEIEKMIDQAVALGRAFPHESTETFIDNLSMLNRTGEAQGFIVDVLETKYGTLDLKTLSLAEKMAAVEEATKGVNDRFNETKAAKIDSAIQEVTNKFSDFGNELINLADKGGALWLINKTVGLVTVSAAGLGNAFKGAGIWVKGLFGEDTKQEMINYRAEVLATEKAFDELIGVAKKPRKVKAVITGIEGKAKPQTQLEIENEVKKQVIIKKTRDDARAKDLKAQKDHVNMLEQFDDEYLRSITEGHEYELIKLDEKYAAYAEHVDDKAQLDEWYNNEVDKLLKDSEEQYKAFGELQEAVVNGMTNAIVQFAMTGKTSMKEMANAIIADLIRIQAQKAVAGLFGGGGSTGIIGGLLGFHTGGSVGHGSNIPSYHTGMRSDERLAKLQVGESVVNRAGTANNAGAIDAMNKGQTVGSGGNVTTADITFEVTAIDARSFDSYLVSNRRTIENIINASLTQNGSVRQTIKGVI